jgi:hypothetical protein
VKSGYLKTKKCSFGYRAALKTKELSHCIATLLHPVDKTVVTFYCHVTTPCGQNSCHIVLPRYYTLWTKQLSHCIATLLHPVDKTVVTLYCHVSTPCGQKYRVFSDMVIIVLMAQDLSELDSPRKRNVTTFNVLF